MDGHRIAGVILSLFILGLGIGSAILTKHLAHKAEHAAQHVRQLASVDVRGYMDGHSCLHHAMKCSWLIGLVLIVPGVTGFVSSLCKKRCMYIIHIMFEYLAVVFAGIINGAGFLAVAAMVVYSRMSGFDLFSHHSGEHHSGEHHSGEHDSGEVSVWDDMTDESVVFDRALPDSSVDPMGPMVGEDAGQILRPLFHLGLILLSLFFVGFMLALANIIHAGSMTGRLAKVKSYPMKETKKPPPYVYVTNISPNDVISTSDKSHLIQN